MKVGKNIVVLTGAGISAESGIRTFRGQDGMWENHRIEDVASPEGFARNPELVYHFYNLRRSQLLGPEVSPNQAHTALGRLADKFNGNLTLVTQNVDNLHERGGSPDVIHMHGELLKMKCLRTGISYDCPEILNHENICECCREKGLLRPDIVWFGEMPYFMEKIQMALTSADIFISIGTSGQVYPAAMFVQMAERAKKIEINMDATQVSHQFDHHFVGPASEEVPKVVDFILEEKL